MICVTYILRQIYGGAMISMVPYYAAHIMATKNLFGVFSWAINIPLIIALVFTPTLVAKMHGIWPQAKRRGYALGPWPSLP